MGFSGTSPQILRAKGWDEFRAKNPQYEEVARVTDDFDAAKALAVVQDLLSRFPKGQLDAIIMQARLKAGWITEADLAPPPVEAAAEDAEAQPAV